MHKKLTQPKVDHYIHWLSRDDHFGMHGCVYDDKSDKLLDEFFELIDQIAPVSKNGVRALWLRAERGPIEDYGNAEEEVACGDFDSVEQFIEEWKAWFPDEIKWYQLQAVQLKDEGYRAVMLGHKYVIVQDKRREPAGFPNEIPEFVQWLIEGVKECIEMLKSGTYNDFIKENLPPEHRIGKILRKHYWDVWPEARKEYFGGKHGATHKIAYQEIAILTPVRVLATSKMTLPGRTWEHLNVWDCPYKMKFDAAEVSQIIIRYDGMYRRCIRAKFTDLCYEGTKGEWRPVGSVLFGNASVIEFNSDTGSFENLLYVQEDVSDTKEQLETKLDNPDEIILDRICDEVFGDG